MLTSFVPRQLYGFVLGLLFLTQITQISQMAHRFNLATETIIGCSYEVANVLGRGFLERVYAKALALELKDKNLGVREQFPIKVYYKQKCVGDFIADMIVNELILIEVKAASGLNNLQMTHSFTISYEGAGFPLHRLEIAQKQLPC